MKSALNALVLLAAITVASRADLATAQNAPAPKQKAASKTADRRVAGFLKKHCAACHFGEEPRSGVKLSMLAASASPGANLALWKKMVTQLRGGKMPPKKRPQPSRAEIQRVIVAIETTLNHVDCDAPRDPGRVTLRRLNRAEYNNTIRDLIGVDFQAAEDFPADDVGYGFDNIGDVLSLPPLLLEKYLAAAERIAGAAIVTENPVAPRLAKYPAEKLKGGDLARGWQALFSRDEVAIDHEFTHAADYLIRVEAYGDQAGDEPVRAELRLDGKKLHAFTIDNSRDKPKFFEAQIKATAGRHRLSVAFLNDFYQPKNPNPKNRDRNLYVGQVQIIGPLGLTPPKPPATHTRLITCRPDGRRNSRDCAREILAKLARRAFRRPVRPEEVERLVGLVLLAERNGDNFEQGIQLALTAVLVSPHFLFRVEADPDGDDPSAVRLLNEHELAARLSYFLWTSMPDEELFRLAGRGALRDNLRSQVLRMLRDTKSEALVRNFAGQWLQIRNLENVTPDPAKFPAWSETLRRSMQRESELFFADVMREDRSIFTLIDSDFTYVDELLAKHYGMTGVKGSRFRRVALTGNQRGGVLSQAAVLTITSDPDRTSPVKRGKWILEQILGTPPPPPPANVEELPNNPEAVLSGSLRQRLEQHRSSAICASCHSKMDPLGFALENYDAIGAWREKDGRFAIDASAVLPDGRKFDGPNELKQILKQDHALFRRSFSEKMLTYALGRGLEVFDRCAVDDICQAVRESEDRFSRLVLAIVESDPFQKRRGQRGKP